ncbi:MAG: 16S rRNA (cytidine(1402)-2'-O)-methyltransferase [Anaerolineaceae bacterium]|nr:16S rRNA (cytidine(1402)-2'-O)-methyltransferase [Anaerolineaceae bacterium]
MGTLYIVPTPLGNLEDITLRALRILGEVSLIATEDTRTTGRLLKHYNIQGRMISHHEHSRPAQLDQLLAALVEGDVALVSEAGTPLLSDPGYELVRLAIQRGINVVSLPGPNAITTALAASGLPPYPFLFAGFLPRKEAERRHFLQSLATQPATLVFFESPHRFQNTLTTMAEILGADRSLAVGRELTKLYEEIWRGTLAEAVIAWANREVRGEITLVVAGAAPPAEWDQAQVETALAQAFAAGKTSKEAIDQVKTQSGWPKREVYALAQTIKNSSR